jgi:hypothetical protein
MQNKRTQQVLMNYFRICVQIFREAPNFLIFITSCNFKTFSRLKFILNCQSFIILLKTYFVVSSITPQIRTLLILLSEKFGV